MRGLCFVILLGWVPLPALGGEVDVVGIAYRIVRKDASPKAWRAFVQANQARFQTWLNDNPSGGHKRFLDDHLLIRALGVPSGKIERLKRFMYWLALYREYREPPPWYIRLLAKKHAPQFQRLLRDFSWERFSQMVSRKTASTRQAAPGKGRHALRSLPEKGPQTAKPPPPPPSPAGAGSGGRLLAAHGDEK